METQKSGPEKEFFLPQEPMETQPSGPNRESNIGIEDMETDTIWKQLL
jgi:hypothetical protein